MIRALKLLVTIVSLVNIAGAREVSSLNTEWKFARYGPMPDGSTLAEPMASLLQKH